MDTPKVESGRLGLQGFTEASEAYGKKSHTEVLLFQKVLHPSDEVLQALQMKTATKESIYELVRRRYWNDDPMTIEQIYIPETLVAGKSADDFTGSLFAIIEQHEPIMYSNQEIEAMLTDKRIGELMKIPVDSPLLKVQSITYTADAKPIFFDNSYYRADKYRFKTTLVRNKLDGEESDQMENKFRSLLLVRNLIFAMLQKSEVHVRNHAMPFGRAKQAELVVNGSDFSDRIINTAVMYSGGMTMTITLVFLDIWMLCQQVRTGQCHRLI